MTQAWQAREAAQQRFLESLQERFRKLEKENDEALDVSLSMIILDELGNETPGPVEDDTPDGDFFDSILKDINEFAKGDEEVVALLTRFLVWLVEGVNRDFESALREAQQKDPMKYFGKASGTDEA